jgi:ketosteroid isomerase-like protein
MTPRELVQSWVEAFNSADADGLAALYAEDAVNHQVAEAPVRGPAAIRQMPSRTHHAESFDKRANVVVANGTPL